MSKELSISDDEHFYRTQFAQSSVIMLLVDPETGMVVDGNKAALSFYGYTYEELTKLHISAINQTAPVELKKLLASFKVGEGRSFEFSHRQSSGAIRTVEVSTTCLQFRNRKLLHSIINDITDRKLTEKALRESEKRYRLLADNAIASVASHEIIFDRDGNAIDYVFLSANPAFEAATGLKAQDIVGRRVSEYFPDIQNSEFLRIYAKVVRTGEPVVFEQYEPKLDKFFYINAYRLSDNQFATVFRDSTDRRRAEDALEQSEERYRLLADNAVACVVCHEMIFDKDGLPVDYAYLSVNPAFEIQTGLRAADVVGKRVTEVFSGPRPEGLLDVYAKVVRTGESTVFEQYEPGLDRYFYINAYRLSENSFATVFRDVTDRKRAEEALQEREAFLRLLLETIPVPVFYKDAQCRYIGVNSAFEKFLGKGKEDIIGKTVADLCPPELACIYDDEDRKLLKQIGTQVYSSYVKNAEGQLRDVIFHKASFQNKNNEPEGLIGVILDVTEIKQAQEALSESEAFLKQLLETVPIPVFYKDRQGAFQIVNKAFETLLWRSKEEIIGKTAFDIRAPEDAQVVVEEDLDLINNPGSKAYYSEIMDGLGTQHSVIVQKTTVLDMNGDATGFIGAVLDITDFKRTEEELRQAQAELARKSTTRVRKVAGA